MSIFLILSEEFFQPQMAMLELIMRSLYNVPHPNINPLKKSKIFLLKK